MSTPIDIIANAIEREDRRVHGPRLAEAAAKALTDDAIVANAVQALRADGRSMVARESDEDLANIARVVLGSVAGR